MTHPRIDPARRPRLARRRARPGRLSRVAASAVAATAAAIVAAIVAAGPPLEQWERSWTPPTGGWALGDLVVVDAAGGITVTTRPEDPAGGGNDLGLVRYAADGTLDWELVRDGGVTGSEGFTDLEATAEGVAAVGVTLTPDGPRTVLLDVASDGTVRWERLVTGPAIAGFLAPQVAIGPAGERVIATDDGSGSGLLAWYSPAGEPAGAVPLPFEGFGGVSALEVDAAGKPLLVTLDAFSRFTVRSIAPDGTVHWTHHEEADGLILSEAFTDRTPDGGLIVAGTFETGCLPEGLAVRVRVWRLTAEGRLDWRTELDAETCSFRVSTALVAGPDGATYLLSQTSIGEPSALTRLDPDGAPAWTRSFTDGEQQTAFVALDLSASGEVLVGGTDSVAGDFEGVRALRYAADGTLAWTGRVGDQDASAPVLLSRVSAGPDQAMALVGTTRPAPGAEFATVIWLDFPACTGDLDDDGSVGLQDVLVLLAAWGPAPGPVAPADLDQDGTVGIADLLTVLAAWGPCPV